jgi:hypothetical protein
MDERQARQARNEAFMREVNERIDQLDKAAESRGAGPDSGFFEFHCECGAREGCSERVELTLAEYDEVRAQDDRFAVFPGHEFPAIERVVRRNERYVLVDKIREVEAVVADDPRGAPPS